MQHIILVQLKDLLSYGELENDTKTTTVSLSKELVGVGFTLSYINAEKRCQLLQVY